MLNIDERIFDEINDPEEYWLLSKLLQFGKKSHPKIDVLMSKTGWKEPKVVRVMKRLVNKGIVIKKKRRQLKNGRWVAASNEYTITSKYVSKYRGKKNLQPHDFHTLEFHTLEIRGFEDQPHDFQPLEFHTPDFHTLEVQPLENRGSYKLLSIRLSIEYIKLLREKIIIEEKARERAQATPFKKNEALDFEKKRAAELDAKNDSSEEQKSCAKKEKKPVVELAPEVEEFLEQHQQATQGYQGPVPPTAEEHLANLQNPWYGEIPPKLRGDWLLALDDRRIQHWTGSFQKKVRDWLLWRKEVLGFKLVEKNTRLDIEHFDKCLNEKNYSEQALIEAIEYVMNVKQWASKFDVEKYENAVANDKRYEKNRSKNSSADNDTQGFFDDVSKPFQGNW